MSLKEIECAPNVICWESIDQSRILSIRAFTEKVRQSVFNLKRAEARRYVVLGRDSGNL